MDTQSLANFVRNWVHYDNLTTSLSKQSQNARKVRDDFEGKIMGMLRENNMENATIQIQGGKLVILEEKHTQPWTLARLEEALKGYYNQPAAMRGGGVAGSVPMNTEQQVGSIMKYLRNNKSIEISKRLKKQVQTPGLPPLPPPPSTGLL
jgi:hypothetical protein